MNPKRHIDTMNKWLAIAVFALLIFAMGIMPFTRSGSAFAASDAAAYTVDFEYEGQTISIEGGSEILASELFERLCIDGDVSAADHVEFTDPQLIRVERTGDDWKLTSLKPFRTEERLTVTMADRIIEIKVTDAGSGNTFVLYRIKHVLLPDERFRTVVLMSRADATNATQVPDQETDVYYDVDKDGYGWMSFETMMSNYYPKYSNAGSEGRYSIVSARDPNYLFGRALCAAGFNQSGVAHGSFGLYLDAASGRGSGAQFDLEIVVNDNSIPVIINVDGDEKVNDVFWNTDTVHDEKSCSPKDFMEHFSGQNIDFTKYAIESSKVGTAQVDSVSVSKLGGQTLSGKGFHADPLIITENFIKTQRRIPPLL